MITRSITPIRLSSARVLYLRTYATKPVPPTAKKPSQNRSKPVPVYRGRIPDPRKEAQAAISEATEAPKSTPESAPESAPAATTDAGAAASADVVRTGKLPANYQSVATKVVMGMIGCVLLIGTSKPLFDRIVRGDTRKRLVRSANEEEENDGPEPELSVPE